MNETLRYQDEQGNWHEHCEVCGDCILCGPCYCEVSLDENSEVIE